MILCCLISKLSSLQPHGLISKLPPLCAPAVDLSLYINEEQLKTRRKRSSPSKRKKKEESSGESGVESEDESHDSEGEGEDGE